MLLPSYFDRFVSNVEPTDERMAAVASAHGVLREHLVEDADLAHPVLETFLSGSYRRETAVQPIKDVDVMVVLDGYEGSDVSDFPTPSAVFSDLKAALQTFYENVELADQRRSIGVTLPDDDIVLDVVPAIAPDGFDSTLYVPDRERSQWLHSNPKAHIANATDVNDQSGGKFKPVTKAFKWWRSRLDENRRPKSFLLETLISAEVVLDGENAADCFVRTLDQLVDRCALDIGEGRVPFVEDPGAPGDNLSVSCGWTFADARWFLEQLRVAQSNVKKAVAAATKSESVACYRAIFGLEFPAVDGEESAPKRLPCRVSLSATLSSSETGPFRESYPSGARKLPKNWWLKFVAATDAPSPLSFRWTVRNSGAEARSKGHITRVEPNTSSEQKEHTAYFGHHTLICEVLKDDVVVARASHIVKVGRG